MEFEEVKKNLRNDGFLEKSLGLQDNQLKVIYKSLNIIDRAINNEDIDKSKMPQGFLRTWILSVRNLTRVFLKDSFSKEERTYVLALIDLGYNIINLFSDENKDDLDNLSSSLDVLRLLIIQQRTIEESITTLILLNRNISNVINDKKYETILTEKFYKEYKTYLSSKQENEDYKVI